MSDASIVEAAEDFLTVVRSALRHASGGREPPDEVALSICMTQLNALAETGALSRAFFRAVASTGVGLGQKKSEVRAEIVALFNSTWSEFARIDAETVQ